MKYRKLNNYKYLLMEEYTIQINIRPPHDLTFRFIELTTTGQLLIKQSYAWDGASGTMSTPKNMMRGSLIHDSLYQLMRLGALDYKTHRIMADKILRQYCLEDGASSIAALTIYSAVRLFGEQYAKPTPASEVNVLEAP